MNNNKFRYYNIYSFLCGMMFFSPVLVLIYVNRNIAVEDIFLFEIAFFIAVFLFEIPSGILGDKYGHDTITKIGIIFSFISLALFAISYTSLTIWLTQFISGIAVSIVNGSQQVTLQKLCIQENESYLHVRKTSSRYAVLGNIFAFIIGGIINSGNPTGEINIMLSAIVWLIGYIFFSKHISCINKESFENDKQHTEITSFNLSDSLKDKRLMFKLLLIGTIMSSAAILYWFQQLYFNQNGVTSFYFGLISSISAILVIIFSKKLSVSNQGENTAFLLLIPAIILLFNINNLYLIPVIIILTSLLKSELSPFAEHVILDISKNNKSTNLSIMSAFNTLITVLFLGLSYLLMATLNQKMAIFIVSILLSVCVILMLFIYNKIVKEERNLEISYSEV